MNTPQEKYRICFENLPVSEAGKRANQLRSALMTFSEVETEIAKDDPSNQDLGSTLILALGTPGAIAVAQEAGPALKELAKGIAAFLSKTRAKITIEANGKVVASGLGGEDAARIAEAFSRR